MVQVLFLQQHHFLGRLVLIEQQAAGVTQFLIICIRWSHALFDQL
jgi:hypothetical protein